VRLPGSGGAPEIATSCGEIFIVMAQSKRSFVEKLDFVTSLGHGSGGNDRQKQGVTTKGPTRVVTDLCIMEPDPVTKELTVVGLHPGVAPEAVAAATGWSLKFAPKLAETPVPTAEELKVLRALHARTKAAHEPKAAAQ
jgi:glutaconate CoA-transferase subunit B